MSLKTAAFEFSDGYNLLMLQAEQGNIEEVRKLLGSIKNLDINQVNNKGSTALALGIKSGSLAVTKELVNAGADVNIKNHSGQSPLLLACWLGFEDIARFLIENGADINATDQRGWTPLMMATYYNFTRIVQLLIQNNADAAIQDSYGKTALDRAKDPEIFRIIKEKLPQSSPQRSREFTSPKQQLSSVQSPSTQKSKVYSGSLRERLWGFSSPQHEDHQRSFDFRSPQAGGGSTIISDSRHSQSQSKERSFSARKPTSSSTLKSVNQNQPPEGEIPISMKQKFMKDELEKTISDQISYFSQKMQNIILQKVSYEVPLQVHKQRNKIRAEAEDTINLRLASIVSSLNTYFNLKLKFCLNKAGFDPSTLDLRPFLDSEEVRQLEIAPIVREHDLESEDFKKIEAMRRRLDEIEAEAYSRRAQSLNQSWSHETKDERADGFKSFGNRWQIKNELLENMNTEFRSASDYLTKYSNDKIGNLIREENQLLSRKMFSELGNVVEKLEEQIKQRFEESITKRVNQITETLTAHPHRHSSPFSKKNSTSSLLTPVAKEFVGTYGLSSSRQKLINELENYGGADGHRDSRTHLEAANMSRSWQQDELNNSRRLQETRSKIQNIKESLNTDFEGSPGKDVEEQSFKGLNKGAVPYYLSPVANPSPSAKLRQGHSYRQEGSGRLERDPNLRRESPIRSSFGSGDKYSVNELVNLMRGQASNTKGGASSRKGSDSRHGAPGHLYASSERNRSYGFNKRDESF